ncbi:general secretion pathway protein D [Colwellia chukchiensis]|uniref:General secretion pathway protein D n=1 Tax=Colwellia chukchiensis TaxID=641665 RepID=A0A1H7HAU7_9GAMM|nr:secretin N-terminal domain-containing protein [Colwellia chukchiensis]SEK46897.1 general secretion pathway protein D [Colwellia chukchiensis]
MNLTINTVTVTFFALVLSGCALSPNSDKAKTQGHNRYTITDSYLSSTMVKAGEQNTNTQTNSSENSKTAIAGEQMQSLKPLAREDINLRKTQQLAAAFPDQPSLTVAVDNMPLQSFLHYAFGELLQVNYIIDKSAQSSAENITLNIAQKISQRRLMALTNDLLISHGLSLQYNDDLYFIHKVEKNKKGQNVVTAVGRELDSVPMTSQEILQIVPLKFGVKISIERALRTLVGVQISTDLDQSALFLQGKREDILRSLEFIHLLDAPANRGKNIGLISLTYITSAEFTKQVKLLLENEGVPVAIDQAAGKNLVMVPIEQVGAIAVFAANKAMLERVRYWAKLIDKPLQSLSKQYFMYHPQYARASDLGDSLSALFGGTSAARKSSNASNKTTTSSTGVAPSAQRNTGVSNENMTLVVDERANALIFYTSGSEYQSLLPLIKKLDVMPRQVLLDITIAEVTLSDEFKHGVEWAIESGDAVFSTKGAFGVTGIGGFSLALNGIDGELNANFISTNNLVKVLSNPSLLVRDGVSATINVGSDISVVGQTTADPINGERQTTSSEYRKTGVDITVTPSINAQGIVIMEVNQSISNTVPNSSGAGGNPDIFERSLKTEVVAQSGQTIILGGLISENVNQNDKKTPWLADVPLLGALFQASGDSNNRTELVMLITPKVIDRTDQWQELTESFKQKMEYIGFAEQTPKQ